MEWETSPLAAQFDNLLRCAEEAGKKPNPDWFPPRLPSNLNFVWTAYQRLSTDRDSMGSGAIRFSAIDAYAKRYGLDDVDTFERFISLVTIIDRIFFEIREEEEKARAKANEVR